MRTPLYELDCRSNNRIYIKREDLYPFLLGGNKARIAQEYLEDMKRKSADCLIGYGNARSNLNRTLALAAAAEHIPFHIVSPSDTDGTRISTFNSRISRLCGAEVHECAKSNVAETVFGLIQELKAKSYKPYYVFGNQYGKGNEAVPVAAYAKVYKEIKRQAEEQRTNFDYIFLALGTGMTMAGLLVSQTQGKNSEKIVGISVARDSSIAVQVVQDYCDQYCGFYGLEDVPHSSIHVLDQYRCGGYGISCEDEKNMINRILTTCGIPLDPTYTGKAFWGMDCYLRENRISGRNVLFIHTGGTPLFYDMVQSLG